MIRRELIQKSGLAGATILTMGTTAMADTHHHKKGKKLSSKNVKLVKSASDCIEAGELCLAHCADLLAAGDKAMGNCNKNTKELLALHCRRTTCKP